MRRSSRIAVPLLKPKDVIPHLGKPTHWKQGRSAKALAESWFHAEGVPAVVAALLSQSPCLAEAELLDAWLERETDLEDGRATPSQTDLLALLGLDGELAVLGIEAKVDESFGPRVEAWLATGGDGKRGRLAKLCATFGVAVEAVGGLRYQLFHRTAAALLEARRFRARKAILIVQSFCPMATGLADCADFFEAIGLHGFARDRLVGPIRFEGIELWAGWASDECPPERLATAVE